MIPFRTAIRITVALMGTALVASLLAHAILSDSLIGYAQVVAAAMVTMRLLSALRRGKAVATEAASGRGVDKNARLIAWGVLIGVGGPFLLWWLLTVLAR